jgi:fumarate reductase subunit C
MQQRIEYEFDAYDNEALEGLSGGLYRFANMIGVVGIALAGLGVAAIVTGRYLSPLAGPAIIVLGLVALAGAVLFHTPMVTLSRITESRGSDITKLMETLKGLDTAHGVFRALIAALVLARIASFLLARLT